MKMIYTNENIFLVANAQNILEAHNIDVILKNEFAQGAIGEISAFDAWPQLWLVKSSDYEKALALIESSSNKQGSEWICNNCRESNDASFEICWKCQHECS